MPPRQLAPDPTASAAAAFAYQLHQLREQTNAGSYRAMAERVNTTHTSLSRAARGTKLPTWETTREFIRACGHNPSEWRERWEHAKEDDDRDRLRRRQEDAPLAPVVLPTAAALSHNGFGTEPTQRGPAPPGAASLAVALNSGARPIPSAAVDVSDEVWDLIRSLLREMALAEERAAGAPSSFYRRQQYRLGHHAMPPDTESTIRLEPIDTGQVRVVGQSRRPRGAHRQGAEHPDRPPRMLHAVPPATDEPPNATHPEPPAAPRSTDATATRSTDPDGRGVLSGSIDPELLVAALSTTPRRSVDHRQPAGEEPPAASIWFRSDPDTTAPPAPAATSRRRPSTYARPDPVPAAEVTHAAGQLPLPGDDECLHRAATEIKDNLPGSDSMLLVWLTLLALLGAELLILWRWAS